MCGRFAITLPDDAMTGLFAARAAPGLPPVPRYNVCPTQTVAAVVRGPEGRRLGPMRWGFVPAFGDRGVPLFNARAETLARKPAFAESARRRRCLIPATGFYEWTRDGDRKQPWFIRRSDDAPMVFAGLWHAFDAPEGRRASCAIVTCAATGPMAELHARVPVILNPEDWPLWLGEAGVGAARLMQELPVGALTFHRVGPRVNSSASDGPELIAPLPD
jgi:putative SOS response-associated peptidase YedK